MFVLIQFFHCDVGNKREIDRNFLLATIFALTHSGTILSRSLVMDKIEAPILNVPSLFER
jgi:hypothetical protein